MRKDQSSQPMTDLVEEIAPLTDDEAEAALIALVETFNGLGCCPVAMIDQKEDEGISFSLHFSTPRARKLIEARAAYEVMARGDGWQPIETAPVDQQVVFAYFGPDQRWNGYAAVVKQFQWECMDKPLATGWPAKLEATHWMPLRDGPPALRSSGYEG